MGKSGTKIKRKKKIRRQKLPRATQWKENKENERENSMCGEKDEKRKREREKE